ncbi:MAG: hypothetical protein R2749_24400 [Acidimicrobiales bacterium]
MYEAIVKGENIPEPGIPELQGAHQGDGGTRAWNVEVRYGRRRDRDARARRGHLPHRREFSGIDLQRPERGSDDDDMRRTGGRY